MMKYLPETIIVFVHFLRLIVISSIFLNSSFKSVILKNNKINND